jgi:hypothetical protein
VAGLLLSGATPAGAVDPPPRPPTSALGLIGDLRLTVLARRALQNDPALARLNLGVRVRDGVATVWGPVPSDTVARRTVAKLETINGIEQVRSELQVRRPADRPLLADIGIPPRLPTRMAAKPDTASGAIRPRPREASVVAGEKKPSPRPATPPPAPAAGRAPAVVPLSVAVERVRQSEPRFQAISVELRGDVVVIGRVGADAEDVTALAQALRRVKGVSEVMVASD